MGGRVILDESHSYSFGTLSFRINGEESSSPTCVGSGGGRAVVFDFESGNHHHRQAREDYRRGYTSRSARVIFRSCKTICSTREVGPLLGTRQQTAITYIHQNPFHELRWRAKHRDDRTPLYAVPCECGGSLQASPAQAGAILTCPACRRSVAVPPLSALRESKSPVHIRPIRKDDPFSSALRN